LIDKLLIWQTCVEGTPQEYPSRWTYSHSLIHPILDEMFCTYLYLLFTQPMYVHFHVDPTFWGMFCIYLITLHKPMYFLSCWSHTIWGMFCIYLLFTNSCTFPFGPTIWGMFCTYIDRHVLSCGPKCLRNVLQVLFWIVSLLVFWKLSWNISYFITNIYWFELLLWWAASLHYYRMCEAAACLSKNTTVVGAPGQHFVLQTSKAVRFIRLRSHTR
jgi:hypothetical protein